MIGADQIAQPFARALTQPPSRSPWPLFSRAFLGRAIASRFSEKLSDPAVNIFFRNFSVHIDVPLNRAPLNPIQQRDRRGQSSLFALSPKRQLTQNGIVF